MIQIYSISSLGAPESALKPVCDIAELWVGKDPEGNAYAYLLAGIDHERQERYGERIYAHTIYPDAITELYKVGGCQWGFLRVEKLPRWRRILRGVVGFVSLVVGTALLTPVVGGWFAILISGVAAYLTRKMVTFGRSTRFSAETAELHLENGIAPKRDYSVFQQLVANIKGAKVGVALAFC